MQQPPNTYNISFSAPHRLQYLIRCCKYWMSCNIGRTDQEREASNEATTTKTCTNYEGLCVYSPRQDSPQRSVGLLLARQFSGLIYHQNFPNTVGATLPYVMMCNLFWWYVHYHPTHTHTHTHTHTQKHTGCVRITYPVSS